jgi:hypothetical protein
LTKSTSINSISKLHKEKEMADFRRWFMAFAVVALLTGLATTASAQIAPATQCTPISGGVTPTIRVEGYTELLGDLVLLCQGGVPTPAGQQVPQVTFQLFLNTQVTSRITASPFLEALLIVDEPNSASNPTRPVLNCGNTGAPDNTVAGPGVCSITSTGNPATTYDGTTGRPNVFQGRLAPVQNTGEQNSVVWTGVPFDPPGTLVNRVLRFTNIRANANRLNLGSSFVTNSVVVSISVSGATAITIPISLYTLAFIQRGLASTSGVRLTNFGLLQCVNQNSGNLFAGSGTTNFATTGTPIAGQTANGGSIRFIEGFNTAWKVKNISFYQGNPAGSNANFSYTTAGGYAANGQTNYPADLAQNVPGVNYYTESGFMWNSTTPVPNPNPPLGFGTVAVSATGNALASVGNNNTSTNTGISASGVANAGTRLYIAFTDIPTAAAIFVPVAVPLVRQGTTGPLTGVAVLVQGVDATGAGAYTAPTTISQTLYQRVTSLAVYEILSTDVNSLEQFDVPVAVAYRTDLANNLPQTALTAKATVGFAPFSTAASWGLASATLPIPRFFPGSPAQDLFSIIKCACNLLFPYVAAVAGYDTGIAVANTSLDPGSAFGFNATRQDGKVTIWYFGEMAAGGSPPPPQTTFGNVVAGTVLPYVLSTGNADTRYRLDGRGNGLQGYLITQAEFQWCHGFAFIGAIGAGPTSPGVSQGYVALILDQGGLFRTTQTSENLAH